jgi:hypothetical protein
LQRAGGYADDLSDLIPTLSPFYEVVYLLYRFWSKLFWSPSIEKLGFYELKCISHFSNFLLRGRDHGVMALSLLRAAVRAEWYRSFFNFLPFVLLASSVTPPQLRGSRVSISLRDD